ALSATRAAAALTRAHRDLGARTQAFAALYEAAQAFAAAPDRTAVLRALGYAVMGQLPADRWALVLDADGPAGSRGLRQPLPPELAERLANLDAPLLAADDDALAAAGLALAVPVTGAESGRGALAVGPRATGRPYTSADRSYLGALGGFAYASLDRVALVESRVEKERLQEEMRLARAIQERLLPRGLPDVPGLDIAVCSRPNSVVAGDYYDLVKLPSGRLVIAVADVAGKGAGAALLMANIQAAVRLIAPEFDRPDAGSVLEQATGRLNRIIFDNTAPGMFVTFVWGVWDGKNLTYCNAGHPPPRLVRADGAIEGLDAGGPLLGVLADAGYDSGSVALHSGDVLVLYSDGLSEAHDGLGSEFGDGPLDATLVARRGGTAHEVMNAACAGAEAFAGGPPGDDLTVLVLKAE
ncbi:MAG TPA: PP2C family protein-serine/threonine phosphatase, partial [Rhodothermales bacterium]|nr:PP2C family protein-serine/threonine phosphatase [Rhodothermales bacterium]